MKNRFTTVTISVKGGTVIDVDAPLNIDVVVRDYDVEGVARNQLKVDEDGEFYREMIW